MGDTAYPLRPWLMTVYGGNPGGARGVYHTALCKTRNVVERSFGIWKKRFYCLDFGLRVHDMTLASKIIVCTSILHNLAIQHGDEGDDLDDLPDQGQNRSILAMDQGPQDIDGIDANEGQARRNLFLNHFTRQHR